MSIVHCALFIVVRVRMTYIEYIMFPITKGSIVNPSLDDTKPIKSVDKLQLTELLPTPDVQACLKRSWSVIVGRVVTKYLPSFKNMRDIVIHQIWHPYQKEASTKSEIVSDIKYN